jgi:hypothetical protein
MGKRSAKLSNTESMASRHGLFAAVNQLLLLGNTPVGSKDLTVLVP